MTVLEELIRNLSRLPGLGVKSASRIAYHLLKTDATFNGKLAEQIGTLKERIRPCSVCCNYSEAELCPVCDDPRRDRGLLCVVEQPEDVQTMEKTGVFNGLYHVLMGAIAPLDGIGPEDLTLARLVHRVRNEGVREVIVAVNPTVEGDTTALHIVALLKNTAVPVSRLAYGLPYGGDLSYADTLTVARSLKARTRI